MDRFQLHEINGWLLLNTHWCSTGCASQTETQESQLHVYPTDIKQIIPSCETSTTVTLDACFLLERHAGANVKILLNSPSEILKITRKGEIMNADVGDDASRLDCDFCRVTWIFIHCFLTKEPVTGDRSGVAQ